MIEGKKDIQENLLDRTNKKVFEGGEEIAESLTPEQILKAESKISQLHPH